MAVRIDTMRAPVSTIRAPPVGNFPGGQMRAFTFDPAEHRDTFAAQGWLHIRGGVAPELLAEMQEMLDRSRAEDPLRGPALAGEKEQHLFAPADLEGFCGQFFDMVSAVCGLRRDRMTLSERHLKVYGADADPYPTAHKDRFASQISVGLTIEVPEESRLLVYPSDDRAPNRFLTTEHKASLAPDELPEVVLRDAQPVEIADAPGDVVLFHGASMWHLRQHSAGAALLYLKCNDFDCDPLAEDPTTPQRREHSLRVVSGADGSLEAQVPVPARRLQSVTVEHGRDWQAETWLTVFGEPRRRISPREVDLLQASDGTRRVAEVAADEEARRALARLVELEALDLIEEPYASSEATASAMASVEAANGSSRPALRS
jgi:hypothetical protein